MAKHHIEKLHAFLIDDPTDGEGVLTRDTPGGRTPMIASTRDGLELFRVEARETAEGLQMPLITAEFHRVHGKER